MSDDFCITAKILRAITELGYNLDDQKVGRWTIGSKVGAADQRREPVHLLRFSKGKLRDHDRVDAHLNYMLLSSSLIYCSVGASSKSYPELQLFRTGLDTRLCGTHVMETTKEGVHCKFSEIVWITRLSRHLFFDTLIRLDLLEQLAKNQGWHLTDQKSSSVVMRPESLSMKHEKYEGSFTASSYGLCEVEGHSIVSYDTITSELTKLIEATQKAIATDLEILRTQVQLQKDLIKRKNEDRGISTRDLHILSRAMNQDGLSYVIINPCGLLFLVRMKWRTKVWKPVGPTFLDAVPVMSLNGLIELVTENKTDKQETEVANFLKDFSPEQIEYVRVVAEHFLPRQQYVI